MCNKHCFLKNLADCPSIKHIQKKKVKNTEFSSADEAGMGRPRSQQNQDETRIQKHKTKMKILKVH